MFLFFQTCSEKGKKRHEFSDTVEHPTRGEYYARDDLEYRVQRSGDLYSDDRGAADNLQGQVSVKLTVYTPEEFLEFNLNGIFIIIVNSRYLKV